MSEWGFFVSNFQSLRSDVILSYFPAAAQRYVALYVFIQLLHRFCCVGVRSRAKNKVSVFVGFFKKFTVKNYSFLIFFIILETWIG